MILLKALLLLVVLGIFFALLVVLRVIGQVKQTLNQFGGGKANDDRQARRSKKPTVHDTRGDAVANRKIFAKDEGEYVDFKE